MTDRELMEFVAKAVGEELVWYIDWNDTLYCCRKNNVCNGTWEPLLSNDHAFELAVQLRLNIELTNRAALVYQDGTNPNEGVIVLLEPDPCEAVRNAIVIAAAEIGRTMK